MKTREITTFVTFGRTLKLPRSISGVARATATFSTIWIRLEISFTSAGVMHQVMHWKKDRTEKRERDGKRERERTRILMRTMFFSLVHSLAAGLFLDTDEIHYFEDFGYQHDLYRHCPSKESNLGCRCECPQGSTEKSIDHDQNWDTCLPRWREWVKKSRQARKTSWKVWS